MKELYLDIMEKALSAYTAEGINDYIDEVKRNGLTEHGFPRLGANIGILIAYGRRTELFPTLIEILNLCCEEIPRKKAANDFSVREVCCCLMLLEERGIVNKELINKWKEQLATIDPWTCYNIVDDHSGKFIGNWAMFGAVSDFVRGSYCGIDTSDFVDWQIPSQLANLDCNDMYMDHPPFGNHTVYDLVPRYLMAFLLRAGYKGKYAARIEQVLDHTADITLKMQSVTGELAFGGRSNQFLHNEPMICSYCEMEAARFAEKGDLIKAGQFKAAALLAAKATLKYLLLNPISHIKNRYDVSSQIGCEGYGYFNKYMITVASYLYPALLFGDPRIAPTVAPAEQGGYALQTSNRFHKVFLNCGGYFLEFDTNADPNYDANGLGRVHKRGCPSAICLSVPFSRKPNYVLENKNPSSMSICCYAEIDGKKLLGAERYADHTLVSTQSSERKASAVFEVKFAGDISLMQTYTVLQCGVSVSLSGYEKVGFMLPVFDFDGANETNIAVTKNCISVTYQNAVCKYRFEGDVDPDFKYYYNRNGRYKVYAVATKELKIEIEEERHES